MIRRPARAAGRRGLTLVEVMVAIACIGLAIVPALMARNQALATAVEARNLSVVSRLAKQFLHRIEAARVPDLFGVIPYAITNAIWLDAECDGTWTPPSTTICSKIWSSDRPRWCWRTGRSMDPGAGSR